MPKGFGHNRMNDEHNKEDQHDGHQNTNESLIQDDSQQSAGVTQDDTHQPVCASLKDDTSLTLCDDTHQSAYVTLPNDSHQSTPITREYKSVGVYKDNNDDSYQCGSVLRQHKDDEYLPGNVERVSEDDSLSSDASKRNHDSHQFISPLCPALAEAPPLPQEAPSAKDRGYGWVVVWAVFWVNTLTAGFIKSFGIMVLLLLQHFPDATGAEIGWITGLLFGTRAILSPFLGALTVKIGGRLCTLLGTVLITLGLLLSIPAFSIHYMILTLGALVGLGISMSETPGYLLVNDYFLEKRSTANGLRAAGNPMGGILFPPMLVFLNHHFGLKGSFIMLAGVMLHLAILAFLMRPFEEHERMILHQHTKATHIRKGTDNTKYGTVLLDTHTTKQPKRKALDFTLFKNPQYLIYLALPLVLNFGLPNILVYLPAYAYSRGLSEYEVSIIISYFSIMDFALRILCGYVTDRLNLNGAYIFSAGLVVGGIGCALVTLCSTLWHLMLAATLSAGGLAIFWTLINTLLGNQFGGEMTASTWGFFRMTQGILNLIYPFLLGMIKDVTGGFVVPFLTMGCGFIVGGCIFLLQPLAAKLSIKAKLHNDEKL